MTEEAAAAASRTTAATDTTAANQATAATDPGSRPEPDADQRGPSGGPATGPDPAAGATGEPTSAGTAEGASTSQEAPPPSGPQPGPPGAGPPGVASMPGGYAGAAFPLRHGLIRPKQGRYLAGVCAAIGRATNTDPVLWRVLLAVLGFIAGIGILVYLAVWLVSPAEGDSASPVEGLLGRGRSSTPPILVVILGMLVALVFGYVVTDGFRAALLGAAVLIGGALLLNRNTGDRSVPAAVGGTAPAGPTAAGGQPPDAPPAPATSPRPDAPSAPVFPPAPLGGSVPATTGAARPGPYPPGQNYPTAPAYPAVHAYPAGPAYPGPTGPGPVTPPAGPPSAEVTAPLGLPTPPAPPSGYRPPFAPYGPYGGGPPGPPPPPVVPPPPKPPKERSRLGSATFSMVFVALGVVTALDLSNAVHIGPSAYFAAPLVTVALGLLVGTWFGRARWLIALGLVLSLALGIATAAESVDQSGNAGSDVTWRPTGVEALATRYENNFGNAVLDLSAVDFTGEDRQLTVEVNFGRLEVILPRTVDVTARVDVGAGEARVFDNRWSGINQPSNAITDLGTDGTGGGRLGLDVHVNAGDVEVHR